MLANVPSWPLERRGYGTVRAGALVEEEPPILRDEGLTRRARSTCPGLTRRRKGRNS